MQLGILYVSVDASRADAFFYSEFLEGVKCESVNISNPAHSAQRSSLRFLAQGNDPHRATPKAQHSRTSLCDPGQNLPISDSSPKASKGCFRGGHLLKSPQRLGRSNLNQFTVELVKIHDLPIQMVSAGSRESLQTCTQVTCTPLADILGNIAEIAMRKHPTERLLRPQSTQIEPLDYADHRNRLEEKRCPVHILSAGNRCSTFCDQF